jgi:hypothetical protein
MEGVNGSCSETPINLPFGMYIGSAIRMEIVIGNITKLLCLSGTALLWTWLELRILFILLFN